MRICIDSSVLIPALQTNDRSPTCTLASCFFFLTTPAHEYLTEFAGVWFHSCLFVSFVPSCSIMALPPRAGRLTGLGKVLYNGDQVFSS